MKNWFKKLSLKFKKLSLKQKIKAVEANPESVTVTKSTIIALVVGLLAVIGALVFAINAYREQQSSSGSSASLENTVAPKESPLDSLETVEPSETASDDYAWADAPEGAVNGVSQGFHEPIYPGIYTIHNWNNGDLRGFQGYPSERWSGVSREINDYVYNKYGGHFHESLNVVAEPWPNTWIVSTFEYGAGDGGQGWLVRRTADGGLEDTIYQFFWEHGEYDEFLSYIGSGLSDDLGFKVDLGYVLDPQDFSASGLANDGPSGDGLSIGGMLTQFPTSFLVSASSAEVDPKIVAEAFSEAVFDAGFMDGLTLGAPVKLFVTTNAPADLEQCMTKAGHGFDLSNADAYQVVLTAEKTCGGVSVFEWKTNGDVRSLPDYSLVALDDARRLVGPSY